MQTWYECKVKSLKVDEGGFERKVTDTYLLDAVSYTDAETRIYELMPTITKGDFKVMSIKPSNITEIISNGNGEWWWKAKISLVTIDEEVGKEKKMNNYLLVSADNMAAAVVYLSEGLSYMLVPYFLESMVISPIVEVFPYNLAEGVERMKANEPTSNPSNEGNSEEVEEEGDDE
jgi:hypothetical protein